MNMEKLTIHRPACMGIDVGLVRHMMFRTDFVNQIGMDYSGDRYHLRH